MGTVLVVDDEPRVTKVLERLMAAEGHSVISAGDGAVALQKAQQSRPDLILLDLMMPKVNGMQVLRALHEADNDAPVIVLSAVGDVGARVQSLERGAVDFVSKPFHAAELVARVRRQLGGMVPRQRVPDHDRYLEAGGVRLDLDRRRASLGDRHASLSEREFELLAHLMRRVNDVCRKDELLHDIWGLAHDPGSNVVEVCVRRLRLKLGDPPIETVRGVGYCFYAS